MTKSIIKLNVIDRKGKKTTIETEEGTTIRDAIDNNLQNVRFCSFFFGKNSINSKARQINSLILPCSD